MTGLPFKLPRESHWSGVTRSLKSGAAVPSGRICDILLAFSAVLLRQGAARWIDGYVASGFSTLTDVNATNSFAKCD